VHVITTPIEHEAVLASCDYLERVHGFRPPAGRRTGRRSTDSPRRSAPKPPSSASATRTTRSARCRTSPPSLTTRRASLHLDAVQAAGWLPLRGTGADALSLAGHKIGAPQGIGVLAVRSRLPLEPVMHGGGQERGRRSGTENLAGAVGSRPRWNSPKRSGRGIRARRRAPRRVRGEGSGARPDGAGHGASDRRLPGTASFTFAGTSGEAVLSNSSDADVVTSSGSACAAGATSPRTCSSRAASPDIAQTAVRFTFGHAPTADLSAVADAVAASVAAVRSGT
jgi:cysteine desulfurase